MNKLSIIIPVYNEEKTIEEILQKVEVLSLPGWDKEIIVVDDGSEDNSKCKVQNAKLQFKIQNFKVLYHEKNRGKGEAIKTALKHATGDYVLIQDADFEYDLNDIPSLLQAARSCGAQAVFGSRNLRPRKRGYPHYVLGGYILTKLANFLYHGFLTDLYTCYKLVRRDLMESLDLESPGFEFEAELAVKILKKGIKIIEVPINYYPRTFAEGKKIGLRDGLLGLWTIFKYSF